MKIVSSDAADLMRYDDLCARIYADKRMPSGTRELALALAWVALRDPERGEEVAYTRRVGQILGRDRGGRWRHKLLFERDCPRYEPPDKWGGSCDGPRMRPYRPRNGSGYGKARESQSQDTSRCGDASARIEVPEYDMVTGQVRRTYWFCTRHKEHAERVRRQLSAVGDPPPPIPNRGGLLPCYFNSERIEKYYRWADPHWEKPYYGLCADDWPVPGQTIVPKRPRLALVIGGPGESEPAKV